MTSQSTLGTSIPSLPATVPKSIPSVEIRHPILGSVHPQELVVNGLRWGLMAAHLPNKKCGVEQLVIWEHSADYVLQQEEEEEEVRDEDRLHSWRCSYCIKTYLVVMRQKSISNAQRHLRVVHKGVLPNTTVTRKRSY